MINITSRHESVTKIIALMLCCVLCMTLFMTLNMKVAFCDEAVDAISDAVSQMSTKIYTTMRKIITPLAAVAFAFAGIQFIVGGKSGTEKARVIMIGAVIAIGLVIFAPLIANEVASWGVGFGGGDLSGYNPLG